MCNIHLRSRRVTGIPIEQAAVSAYVVPTASPESDGTLDWQSRTPADIGRGRDTLAIPGSWEAMVQAVRKLGGPECFAGDRRR